MMARKTVLLPHDDVKVVAGSSACKAEISIHESLISHSNTHYARPAHFDIYEAFGSDPRRPTKSIRDGRGFNISLQRTPRMPDDNKLHQLPGTLGSYELYNVAAYADKLPPNIKEAGGVFMPMWQREAMWINFDTRVTETAAKYAVRIFIGRVNAISGQSMVENPAMKSHTDQNQDYVVIPGQRWLDGICVAPGVVRQFVAMPREYPFAHPSRIIVR